MESYKGVITHLYLTKKIGFIFNEEQNETVFFHAVGVCDPKEFNNLREGQPVEYMKVPTKKGPKAIGIVAI